HARGCGVLRGVHAAASRRGRLRAAPRCVGRRLRGCGALVRLAVAVVLACGCGPSVGSGEGSESGSHGSESSSTSLAHESSGANGSVATSIDTSTGDTGSIVDETCVQGDPNACPEGCYRGDVWRVLDDACTTSSVAVCLPAGPKPGVPTTTFWT